MKDGTCLPIVVERLGVTIMQLAYGVTTAKCEFPLGRGKVRDGSDDVPAQRAFEALAVVIDEYCTGTTSPFAWSIASTAER